MAIPQAPAMTEASNQKGCTHTKSDCYEKPWKLSRQHKEGTEERKSCS